MFISGKDFLLEINLITCQEQNRCKSCNWIWNLTTLAIFKPNALARWIQIRSFFQAFNDKLIVIMIGDGSVTFIQISKNYNREETLQSEHCLRDDLDGLISSNMKKELMLCQPFLFG